MLYRNVIVLTYDVYKYLLEKKYTNLSVDVFNCISVNIENVVLYIQVDMDRNTQLCCIDCNISSPNVPYLSIETALGLSANLTKAANLATAVKEKFD